MRLVLLLIITGLLAGCGAGQTSGSACSTTTTTDANGNPISTVACDN